MGLKAACGALSCVARNQDDETEAKTKKQETGFFFFSWLENSLFIQAGGAVAQREALPPHSSRVMRSVFHVSAWVYALRHIQGVLPA